MRTRGGAHLHAAAEDVERVDDGLSGDACTCGHKTVTAMLVALAGVQVSQSECIAWVRVS